MSIELGADYSCYVQPEITQNRANAFYAAGMRRCALAMDTSPETLNSAQALYAAGINLDGYRELSGPAGYADQTSRGIAAFPMLSKVRVSIRRYWLTVEDVSVGIRPDILVPAVQSAVAAASGYDIGLYTGLWYYPDYMGNSTAFAALPLWHAGYNNHAALEPVNYGGWTQMNAHQYASPVVIDGIGLDVDAWWVDDPVPPGPGPTPPVPVPNVTDAILHLESALADLKAA